MVWTIMVRERESWTRSVFTTSQRHSKTSQYRRTWERGSTPQSGINFAGSELHLVENIRNVIYRIFSSFFLITGYIRFYHCTGQTSNHAIFHTFLSVCNVTVWMATPNILLLVWWLLLVPYSVCSPCYQVYFILLVGFIIINTPQQHCCRLPQH